MLSFVRQRSRRADDNQSAVLPASASADALLLAFVCSFRLQQARKQQLQETRAADGRRYRSRNCGSRRRRLGAQQPLAQQSNGRLLETIAELEQRRSLLLSVMVNARLQSQDRAIKVAEGFYTLLVHGYSPPRLPEASEAAAAFLRTNMSHDVEWTTTSGVDAFLTHYQLYTDSYASLQVSVASITVVREDPMDGSFEIRTEGKADICINRATLARFFPHVLEDEYVAQQCIGQRCTVEYSKVFYIRDGLIIRHGPYVTGGGPVKLIHTPRGFAHHVRTSIASTHQGLESAA